MITLTTDTACTLELKEIVIGDPATFDTSKSHVEDDTEPLALRPGQSFDYDNIFAAVDAPTPDENFGVFAIKAVADPAGKTSHSVTTDPAVTRVVYEKSGSHTRGPTAPASLKAGETVYAWLSDGTRFPCKHTDCHVK